MVTLKQAITNGKLEQFVTEHGDAPKGNPDAFNRTLASMAGKSKEAPKASPADGDGD